MIALQAALELIDGAVEPLPKETQPVLESVGRRLAQDVLADVNSPPHDKSVMDGYAVRTADVAAGVRKLEVAQTIIAGGWPEAELQPGQAARIMTGAPIPAGADAVVMVELTEVEPTPTGEYVTLKIDSLEPEKHVLRTGVNFSRNQKVFSQGHQIRATDVGLLAEVGAATISVGAQPTVAVLPTGNELVACDQVPQRGEIRNSNGPMLTAMARSIGLEVTQLGVGRDDAGQLRELIEAGLESDLLLLSGGVSAGTMDLVPGVLAELRVEQVFHKVKVKPGKPIWFGVANRNNKRRYVFGLPGNPVSSLVGFQLFVRAAINKLMGGQAELGGSIVGELAIEHQTRGDRPTFWPGQTIVDQTPVQKIKPLVWRGSSDLLALGSAEGLIYFPAHCHDNKPGKQVQFYPFA